MEVDPLMSAARFGKAAKGIALALALAPAVALACPYCAAKDDGGNRTLLFIGSMVALPFIVGGATVKIIRHLDSDSPTTVDAAAPRDDR